MMYKVTIKRGGKIRAFLVAASDDDKAMKLVSALVSDYWTAGEFVVEEAALCMELRSTYSASIPS